MAPDVFLQEKPEPPTQGTEYEEILYFDDDEEVYYWFLYPLFQKLYKRTGQMIDLYGTAVFGGNDLKALADTIANARQLTENQPDEWDVVIGFEVGSPRREIREPVSKARMLFLLDALGEAIDRAISKHHYLAFWGD